MSDVKKCGNEEFLIALPSKDGGTSNVGIRHNSDHTWSYNKIYPLSDGKPIPKNADIFECGDDGIYRPSKSVANGPSKVNNRAYKNGWDNIFGKSKVATA